MTRNPELILLDINLPKVDGLQICEFLRINSKVPIIILTADDTLSAEINGLNLGADDFLRKPIEPEVLLARVEAVTRRYSNNLELDINTVITFGEFSLNPLSQIVQNNGLKIILSAKEYELLYFLVRNPGIILNRDLISKSLYGVDYDPLSSRVIDLRVVSLRKKLNDKKSEIIKTVWGKGYLFDPSSWG